jgi:hypothetical protein
VLAVFALVLAGIAAGVLTIARRTSKISSNTT